MGDQPFYEVQGGHPGTEGQEAAAAVSLAGAAAAVTFPAQQIPSSGVAALTDGFNQGNQPSQYFLGGAQPTNTGVDTSSAGGVPNQSYYEGQSAAAGAGAPQGIQPSMQDAFPDGFNPTSSSVDLAGYLRSTGFGGSSDSHSLRNITPSPMGSESAGTAGTGEQGKR